MATGLLGKVTVCLLGKPNLLLRDESQPPDKTAEIFIAVSSILTSSPDNFVVLIWEVLSNVDISVVL